VSSDPPTSPEPQGELEALKKRVRELEQHRERDAALISKLRAALVDDDGSDTWLAICDGEGRLQRASAAVEQASGFSLSEMRGRKPGELWSSGQMDEQVYHELWASLERGEPYRNVFVNRRRNGELFLVDQTIAPVFPEPTEPTDSSAEARDNPKASSFIATGRELTDVNEMARGLRYLALVDPLTELPNRTLFNDLASRAIAAAKRREGLLAVVVVDVNRFVYVNERFGVEVGDQVLVRVAERLRALAGDTNIVARVGGDEYAVLLSDVQSVEDVVLFADRARHELALPLAVTEHEILLTVCLGVSVYPDDGDSTEQLVSRASMALSKARQRGRGECVFFKERMNAEAVEFLALKEGLYTARQQDQFAVHYQPYFCLRTQRIAGVEALARWHSETLGWVAPSRFIPVLEDTGLIGDVGRVLFEKVCAQLAQWRGQGFRAPVSINLSAQQFADEGLLTGLLETVGRHGLTPPDLVLEITESTVMDDIGQASEVLLQLKQHGFAIAIDDFGTGYSSLSYLRSLPLDVLKIDLSFVRELTLGGEAAKIVNAVISMAHSLELRTVAEGVERDEHLAVLAELGCDAGQGFLWSRALCADDFTATFADYFGPDAPPPDCERESPTKVPTAPTT
jgi:diguanylate cyclase (GGDEF)-like protein/PAS domain S-box-containing protein